MRAGPNYQYWPESGWIPHAVLKRTLHLSNLGDCSPPQLMTAEQVKAMSVADHQNDWRMLVFRLAILIPETQGRLDTAAGRRLKVGYTCLYLMGLGSTATIVPLFSFLSFFGEIVICQKLLLHIEVCIVLVCKLLPIMQEGLLSRVHPTMQCQTSGVACLSKSSCGGVLSAIRCLNVRSADVVWTVWA